MNRVLLIFLILFISACKKENLGDCIKSTGKIITEERTIGSFRKIEVFNKINLYVRYASEYKLSVKGGKNLLELVETKVENNKLIIENKNKCNWVRSFKNDIDVYIESPHLNEFTFYGAGEIVFENTFISDTLLVNMWEASGDLNLNVESNYVELKSHTGTATISCIGKAKELVAYMGGNGFVKAAETISDKVLAVNENTGYIEINAQKELEVDIRGSGNVFYKGAPEIDLDKSGSGDLIAF